MALYTFRCDTHGDFPLEQPMAETTRTASCPLCGSNCSKVLGGALQFTYGRDAFHDGVEGGGETLRETGARWRREFREYHGRDVEPVGTRWV
jgi:putative FmdB family regulatory protein